MLNLQRNDCQFLFTKKDVEVIALTRSNGATFYLNPELIQTVESTPDTVITLVSNKKLIVKDTPQEISERFIEYRCKTQALLYFQKAAE
jgi:flagellar protein FlbD